MSGSVYIVTCSDDPAIGHCYTNRLRDEALQDLERVKVIFPHACVWERGDDGKMVRVDEKAAR